MKPRMAILLAATAVPTFVLIAQLFGAEAIPSRAHEYVTIRWGGRDNTHIVRPGGQVEFVGTELRKVTRPDRTDERSFYLNMVMNGLTKEGYRFVAFTHDEVIMERPVK